VDSSQFPYFAPSEYGLESVCPSMARVLGSLPNSSAGAVRISSPSALMAWLPLSKNVPFSDSVSSMPKPSLVTLVSM
jgi:hypothetical protein